MSALVAEVLAVIEAERAQHQAAASELPIDQRGHELGIVHGLDRAAALVGRLGAEDQRRLDELAALGVPT